MSRRLLSLLLALALLLSVFPASAGAEEDQGQDAVPGTGLHEAAPEEEVPAEEEEEDEADGDEEEEEEPVEGEIPAGEPETDPDADPDNDPDPDPETNPDINPDPAPEPDPESDPDSNPAVIPDPEPDPAPGPEPIPDPDPDPDPEPETGIDPGGAPAEEPFPEEVLILDAPPLDIVPAARPRPENEETELPVTPATPTDLGETEAEDLPEELYEYEYSASGDKQLVFPDEDGAFPGEDGDALNQIEGALSPDDPELAAWNAALDYTPEVSWSMEDGELIASAYIPQFWNNANTDATEDAIDLPAVRNQNPFGTCWAFSAVGGMEMDLIRDGQADATIDLSEYFLAYFLAHDYDYPRGGMGKDSAAFVVDYKGYTYLDIGGNSFLAVRLLSAMMGVPTEEDSPYPRSRKETEEAPASTAIAAQLTGAYYLSAEKKNEIKQMITEHGAVGASIWAQTGDLPEGYFAAFSGSGKTTCLFTNVPSTNHDILFVGWDDHFPAAYFSSCPVLPEHDGAWLVRNSWGGNEYGVNGYFWLSYEDASYLCSSLTAYDAQNDPDLMDDFAYSYDRTPGPYWDSYDPDPEKQSQAETVQTFTVYGDEKIQAVGVETDNDELLDLSVTVTAAGQTAAGQKLNARNGFHRIAVSPQIRLDTVTEVTVTVVYKAKSADVRVNVPYQQTGEGYNPWILGGEGMSYILTAGQDSAGFTINGRFVQGDPTVKLYTKDDAPVPVSAVTLDQSRIDASPGEVYRLTAAVAPENATNKELLWTSSDENVATVDETGKVTMGSGEYGGEAVITATSVSGGKSASCTVSLPKTLQKLTIQGFDSTRKATLTYDNSGSFRLGMDFDVTLGYFPVNTDETEVTWTSSNPAVISVESVRENGTAVLKAVANGTAEVTVASKTRPEITDTGTFTLYFWRPVQSVSLDAERLTLTEGDTYKLTAAILPEDADDKTVAWTTSNAAAATVGGDGTVTAVKWGTATITVTTQDEKKTASCTVTVKPKDPVEAFVYRLYGACHRREPDAEGLQYWAEGLRSGQFSGAEVADAFYTSAEMADHGYPAETFVSLAYTGIMDREPDGDGLEYWVSFLDRGVSPRYIIRGFTDSNEFAELCQSYGITRGGIETKENRDRNPGITGFVTRLYTKVLGRAPDTDGLNYWCGVLYRRQERTYFLRTALDGFLHSKEFLAKKLNDTEYLQVLYRAFLDREPDEEGLLFWAQRLQSGSARDAVAKEFSRSAEFDALLTSYGIR